MKDFLSLARERYSCRSFSLQPLEKEKLELILEAGRLAPSAKNKQPLRFVIINEREALEKVKKATSCTYNSQCIIAICYQKEECWSRPFDGKLSGDIDASIACTSMMLEATELGIGSVWVMWFDNEKLKEEFTIPSTLEVSSLLVLGYPSKDANPSLNHEKRKSKEEFVRYNSFDE